MHTNTILFFINNMQPFPIAASPVNPNAFTGWMSNGGAASSVQPAVVSTSNLPIIPNQGQGLYLNIFQIHYHMLHFLDNINLLSSNISRFVM